MNQIQPPTSQEEGSRGDMGKARPHRAELRERQAEATGPLGPWGGAARWALQGCGRGWWGRSGGHRDKGGRAEQWSGERTRCGSRGERGMEGGECSGELGPGRLVRLWVLPTGQQGAQHSGSVRLCIARWPMRSARRAKEARQEVAGHSLSGGRVGLGLVGWRGTPP